MHLLRKVQVMIYWHHLLETSISLEDAFAQFASNNKQDLYGAKVDGIYDDYVRLMIDKHNHHNRQLKGSVILVDSYDGSEHHKRRDKKSSIVSFSSQMFSHSTVKDGATPAQSCNILTWQQIEGPECAQNIFPVIKSVFERKKILREEGLESLLPGCNVSLYDLHDGKCCICLLSIHCGVEDTIPSYCENAGGVKGS